MRLRCEIRLKDFLLQVCGDPGAVVFDGEMQRAILLAQLHADASSMAQRFDGIHQQIRENIAEGLFAAPHFEFAPDRLECELHAAPLGIVPQQTRHLLCDSSCIHVLSAGATAQRGFAEAQELPELRTKAVNFGDN